MDDLISRQAAIDALNGLVNRFEQLLRDIRESKVDDSVCGLCEYDGAYIGQSGDWFNECPGFDKDDCFKLSDDCRKRWLKEANLPSAQPIQTASNYLQSLPTSPLLVGKMPSAQPETHEKRTETHACDCISRQAALDCFHDWIDRRGDVHAADEMPEYQAIEALPPAQPAPSLWFRIGEVCVDESKGNITAEVAIKKIRALLRTERRKE